MRIAVLALLAMLVTTSAAAQRTPTDEHAVASFVDFARIGHLECAAGVSRAGHAGWSAVLCNAVQANAPALGRRCVDLHLSNASEPSTAGARPARLRFEELARRSGLYRNARTGQPHRLTVREGALHIGDGMPLTPASATRFRIASGTELVFDRPRERGERAPFKLLTADEDVVPYDPMAEFRPSGEALSAFAGHYRIEEAEARFATSVEQGRLLVTDRYATTIPLDPSYEDAFTAGSTLYRFIRDTGGAVVQVSMGVARVWDLRFDRLSEHKPSAPPAYGQVIR